MAMASIPVETAIPPAALTSSAPAQTSGTGGAFALALFLATGEGVPLASAQPNSALIATQDASPLPTTSMAVKASQRVSDKKDQNVAATSSILPLPLPSVPSFTLSLTSLDVANSASNIPAVPANSSSGDSTAKPAAPAVDSSAGGKLPVWAAFQADLPLTAGTSATDSATAPATAPDAAKKTDPHTAKASDTVPAVPYPSFDQAAKDAKSIASLVPSLLTPLPVTPLPSGALPQNQPPQPSAAAAVLQQKSGVEYAQPAVAPPPSLRTASKDHTLAQVAISANFPPALAASSLNAQAPIAQVEFPAIENPPIQKNTAGVEQTSPDAKPAPSNSGIQTAHQTGTDGNLNSNLPALSGLAGVKVLAWAATEDAPDQAVPGSGLSAVQRGQIQSPTPDSRPIPVAAPSLGTTPALGHTFASTPSIAIPAAPRGEAQLNRPASTQNQFDAGTSADSPALPKPRAGYSKPSESNSQAEATAQSSPSATQPSAPAKPASDPPAAATPSSQIATPTSPAPALANSAPAIAKTQPQALATSVVEAPAGGLVQSAHLASSAGRAEMHIDLRTQTFGSVEVHTVVRGGQVGLEVGSERGDLRAFLTTEASGLQTAFHQQDLHFDRIHFLGQGAGIGAGFSGRHEGQSRPFQQGRVFRPAASGFEPARPKRAEIEASPESRNGLSVHA